MDFKCELIQQSAQPVLSIRTRTPMDNLKQTIGSSYDAIMQYLSEIGENASDAPFVAYYNMDMQDLDVEIGYPVGKAIQGKDEIKQSEIPYGRYAACLYTGSYSKMESAYNAISEWMKENGYTPTGVVYEFYLNDPQEIPEDELQTRIMFPLV